MFSLWYIIYHYLLHFKTFFFHYFSLLNAVNISLNIRYSSLILSAKSLR